MSETSSTPRNASPAGSARAEPSRFRGFPSATRDFFRMLEEEPCPDVMPGESRAAYAAHVLSPLKDLVSDLASLLADVRPSLGLQPRVGASLYWPGGPADDPDECPVRQIRIWDAESDPDHSPVLHVTLSADGVQVGVAAAGADPVATARMRHALLESPGGEVRRLAAGLLAAGWEVRGAPLSLESVKFLPVDLAPWAREHSLGVARTLEWEPWIGEPGLAREVSDRFRELLPVFDVMRDAAGRAVSPGTGNQAARTSAER